MNILKLCGVFLSSSADTQPVLSLLSLLVPRSGADIIWHGVTYLTESAQKSSWESHQLFSKSL